MSEKNRKQKKKKEWLTWGFPCAAQPQQAGPASRRPSPPGPPPLSSSSPTGERRVPTRAHRRASTSCFPGHLLLPPRRLERPGRRHAATATPRTSLLLSHSSPPPLVLSLPTARTRPSPPLAVAIATGLPSPPRHARKLRPLALKLLVEPRTSGRPPSPLSPSSSSSGSAVRRRRFAVTRPSPTPLCCSA